MGAGGKRRHHVGGDRSGKRSKNVGGYWEKREISELRDRIEIEMPPPRRVWVPSAKAEEKDRSEQIDIMGKKKKSEKNSEKIEKNSEKIEQNSDKIDKNDEKMEKNSDKNREKLDNEHNMENLILTKYKFNQLPISKATLKGLENNKFVHMSPIQYTAIPHALAGRDILGEAKTGSGKTIAFAIPVLEKLFREFWTPSDGLGALVISPTRELAAQIFSVFTRIGRFHDFSAGCILGGKNIEGEQQRINILNLIVATPGRLLNHVEESPLWDASKLQILVLDEADKMVEMGFSEIVHKIAACLPEVRQTYLFSATLKSSISRFSHILSLNNAERITVSERANPEQLKQTCLLTDFETKLSTLFSFLKINRKKKIIVFLSSCKQVRFIHDAFLHLSLGMHMMELQGRQSQQKRLAVSEAFKLKRENVVLFATDIVSRGIDFPAVDWVVQADCPDSAETYIHRAGRTARFDKKGENVLLLLKSETHFLKKLKHLNIPLASPNFSKTTQITAPLQALLLKHEPLKYLAERAVVSYVKSIRLLKSEGFSIDENQISKLASSFGLSHPPSIPDGCHDQDAGKKQKNMSKLDRLKAKIKDNKLRRKTASPAPVESS